MSHGHRSRDRGIGHGISLIVGSLVVVGLALVPACGDDPDPEPVGFTEPGTVFEVDVGDEYVGPEDQLAGSELVGAGGRQELTFEAVGVGTAEVSLWYVRSFDDPKEPADRAVFEVIVTA